MLLEPEHRAALASWRSLSLARPPAASEHRSALVDGQEPFRAERARARRRLHEHREVLETIREKLARDRTLHRRAYAQDRWPVALAERVLAGLDRTSRSRAA